MRNLLQKGGGAMKPKKPSEKATARQRAKRLREILEIDLEKQREPPPASWSPEIGDKLTGEFRGWAIRDSRFGGKVHVALVRSDAGVLYSVWCETKRLKSAMDNADPQPADGITIERGGDIDIGRDYPLKTFRVVVEKNDGSPPRAYGKLEGGGQ